MTSRPITRARTREAEARELDRLRAIYPRRAGDNPWPEALTEIRARLEEGHTWIALLDGARRYSNFCAATGVTGSVFVMRAAKFYGAEQHFRRQWMLPAEFDPRAAAEAAWMRVLSGGHLEHRSRAARAAASVGGQYAIRHAHVSRELPFMHRRFIEAFNALAAADSAIAPACASGDSP